MGTVERANAARTFCKSIISVSSEPGFQSPNVFGYLDLKVEHHCVNKSDKTELHGWFDSKDDAPRQP